MISTLRVHYIRQYLHAINGSQLWNNNIPKHMAVRAYAYKIFPILIKSFADADAEAQRTGATIVPHGVIFHTCTSNRIELVRSMDIITRVWCTPPVRIELHIEMSYPIANPIIYDFKGVFDTGLQVWLSLFNPFYLNFYDLGTNEPVSHVTVFIQNLFINRNVRAMRSTVEAFPKNIPVIIGYHRFTMLKLHGYDGDSSIEELPQWYRDAVGSV